MNAVFLYFHPSIRSGLLHHRRLPFIRMMRFGLLLRSNVLGLARSSASRAAIRSPDAADTSPTQSGTNASAELWISSKS